MNKQQLLKLFEFVYTRQATPEEAVEEYLRGGEFFEYEYVPTQEKVRKHIKECEGKHTQQAIYSTFHDALTQVCYGCKKVRSTIRR